MLRILGFLIALSALSGMLPLEAADSDVVTEKPLIDINFDDDASSISISTTWKEGGKERKETFSYGKDMYLAFTKQGREWVKDDNFRSRNWEAFLYPDATAFLLMEREYDGKKFENISLRYFQYYPKHRSGSLRPANGSPWWSPDGKQLAMVEQFKDKTYNMVLYDAESGRVLKSRTEMSESAFKEATEGFARARICDDELPCDTPTRVTKKKTPKAEKKRSRSFDGK